MKPSFLVIDKPVGITSHDVVAMLRAVTGAAKVGHTGTLDPFATGVLPLAFGPATRLIQHLDEDCKVYEARVQLGAATDTGDLTGVTVAEAPIPALERPQVEAVLATFLGRRMQTPPRHSAVKVKGKPLYAYARAGEEVVAAARPIRVDAMTLADLGEGWLDVVITCGRGTYARVLAEEIGVALGTVAHLTVLRRARSGPFFSADALDLSRVAQIVAETDDWRAALRSRRGEPRLPWRHRDLVLAELEPYLRDPDAVLGHFPAVEIDALSARRVRQGGQLAAAPGLAVGQRFRLRSEGALLALGRVEPQGPILDLRLVGEG